MVGATKACQVASGIGNVVGDATAENWQECQRRDDILKHAILLIDNECGLNICRFSGFQ
jgi:hypothetical protein